MICVIMSWAGFWIKLSVPPARVGLCITTYLSLKTLGQARFRSYLPSLKSNCKKRSKSFIRDIPKVPYIKIIDVWMFACESSVFMTLIEFTMAQVYESMVYVQYPKICSVSHATETIRKKPFQKSNFQIEKSSTRR